MTDLTDKGIRSAAQALAIRYKYGAKPLVLADEIAALARSIRDAQREADATGQSDA